jgi:Flp pilus assembly protein TadD
LLIVLFALVLLGSGIWAVYGLGITSPFIFDDVNSVIENPSIVHLWPLLGDAENPGPLNPPKDLPTSGRPLVNFTFALNYHINDTRPLGFHVFNIMTHMLVALLLAATVCRILKLEYFGHKFDRIAVRLSLLIALLWALHPLQTEAVQYITQRTELLCGFFYLATIYLSLRYWSAHTPAARGGWIILASICCVLGMTSKEMMASAPFAVLLFERTFINGSFLKSLRRSAWLYVSFIPGLIILFYIISEHPHARSVGFYHGVAAHQWWLVQTKVLWLDVKLCLWPWPLSLHYGLPYPSFEQAIPWVLLTAALCAAILWGVWRRSSAGFVGAFVMMLLLPTMIVPITTEVAAERRLYLPLTALITLVVAGGYSLLQKLASRRAHSPNSANDASAAAKDWPPLAAIAAPALVLAMIYGFVSAHRLGVYRDELSLWRDTAESQPGDYISQYNYGLFLRQSGQYGKAIVYLKRALDLNVDVYETYNELGAALDGLGDTAGAMKCWQQSIEMNPQYPQGHNNLARALSKMGQTQAALDEFHLAIKCNPSYSEAYNNLAITLVSMGRLQEAVVNYQHSISLNPNRPKFRNNYAVALLKLGRAQEAIEQCRRAIELEPDYYEAYYNLGIALSATGRPREAIEQYQKALALKPNLPMVHNNLGTLLARQGHPREAMEHFQQAVQAKPDYAEAHNNLGIMLQQSGQLPQAIEEFRRALELKPAYHDAANNLNLALKQIGAGSPAGSSPPSNR